MIHFLKLTVISALLMISAVHAEIADFPTMKAALEVVDTDSLVLFDLDNTVMMAPQTIGCEEWFDYILEKRTAENLKNGMLEKEAKTKAATASIADWMIFHINEPEMIPVEADTASLIAGIQAKGAKTMALTARGDELMKSTREELKSIGINLALAAPYAKKLEFKKKEGRALYEPGLLLVGPYSKGEAITQFLKATKLKPKKIVFIDNKKHHVEGVEKALEATGIPYYGRRHGAADAKIAGMDKQVVDVQQKYFFGEPLSNEDAKKLITK